MTVRSILFAAGSLLLGAAATTVAPRPHVMAAASFTVVFAAIALAWAEDKGHYSGEVLALTVGAIAGNALAVTVYLTSIEHRNIAFYAGVSLVVAVVFDRLRNGPTEEAR